MLFSDIFISSNFVVLITIKNCQNINCLKTPLNFGILVWLAMFDWALVKLVKDFLSESEDQDFELVWDELAGEGLHLFFDNSLAQFHQIVCHYLPRWQGGEGVKKSHFCGDVIFEWPLSYKGILRMLWRWNTKFNRITL